MNGKTDIAKGRVKEAAGALSGNDKLRKKGRMDQSVGHAKESVGKAIDKASKRMGK